MATVSFCLFNPASGPAEGGSRNKIMKGATALASVHQRHKASAVASSRSGFTCPCTTSPGAPESGLKYGALGISHCCNSKGSFLPSSELVTCDASDAAHKV